MSLSSIAQHTFEPRLSPSLTTDTLATALMASAAALELGLREAERRADRLERELQEAQRGRDRAVAGIRILRRCHRNQSHAKVTALFRQMLADLNQ